MPTVFIVVVSLATYAVGAVTTRRMLASRPSEAVHPIEVLLAAGALAGMALARRPPYAGTYCLLCAGSMFLMGATISGLTTGKRVAGGTKEFVGSGTAVRAAGAWKPWLSFSRAAVDYEFRLLLVACYLLIIGPVAMAFRFLGATPTGGSAASTWIPKSDAPTLDAARRPF